MKIVSKWNKLTQNGEKWRNMFLGTYKPNFSGKGRIVLPKKIRKEISSDQLVLSIGFEECIFGFEEKAWANTIAPDLNRPLSDAEGRKLRRKMCANATTTDLDSQSRFVISEELLSYAKIKNEVLIIGAGDHFEIWSPEKWQEYSK